MGKIAYITVIPQVFEMIDGTHMVPVVFNTQKIRTKIVVSSDEELEQKLTEIREKIESYGTSA